MHTAAAPLLPLQLDRLRRLTVLGPLANRSGEARRCLTLHCPPAPSLFARAGNQSWLTAL